MNIIIHTSDVATGVATMGRRNAVRAQRAPEVAVQDEGHDHPEHDRPGHRQRREVECPPEGVPEAVVRERGQVMSQPDEAEALETEVVASRAEEEV